MKVSKIEKITNEIDRTQNTIAQQTERLKKLQNELLIARQEELVRICTAEDISIDNIELVIREYRKSKNHMEDVKDYGNTEYETL